MRTFHFSYRIMIFSVSGQQCLIHFIVKFHTTKCLHYFGHLIYSHMIQWFLYLRLKLLLISIHVT